MDLCDSILSTLLYFDYFKYPLKLHEVHQFLDKKTSIEQVKKHLQLLLDLHIVYTHNQYYALSADIQQWVEKREQNFTLSQKYWTKANKYSRFIGKFPYVRAVFISGSLSKNNTDTNGDIDYFIVTKNNRLWVCRTLLVLFKKIFLLNSKKYFCVNYFVSEDYLTIPDENRFVAMELFTMRLMYQEQDLRTKILQNNSWAVNLLPNYDLNHYHYGHLAKKRKWHKRFSETIFNNFLGSWLDNLFHKITFRQWKRKFGHLSEETFEVAFRSLKHSSKHHPHQYQQKVMQYIQERLPQYMEKCEPLTFKVMFTSSQT
jgi:hypothetical protein